MANSSLVSSLCTLSSLGSWELSLQNTNLTSSLALNNPPAPCAWHIGQVAMGFVICWHILGSWRRQLYYLLCWATGRNQDCPWQSRASGQKVSDKLNWIHVLWLRWGWWGPALPELPAGRVSVPLPGSSTAWLGVSSLSAPRHFSMTFTGPLSLVFLHVALSGLWGLGGWGLPPNM